MKPPFKKRAFYNYGILILGSMKNWAGTSGPGWGYIIIFLLSDLINKNFIKFTIMVTPESSLDLDQYLSSNMLAIQRKYMEVYGWP